MNSTLVTWEDEDNNRQIQFSVDYSSESGAVEIEKVTPEKVSMVCPDTNTCLRTIGVWTDAGRNHLANKFRQSTALQQLKSTLGSHLGSQAPQMTISRNGCETVPAI